MAGELTPSRAPVALQAREPGHADTKALNVRPVMVERRRVAPTPFSSASVRIP